MQLYFVQCAIAESETVAMCNCDKVKQCAIVTQSSRSLPALEMVACLTKKDDWVSFELSPPAAM